MITVVVVYPVLPALWKDFDPAATRPHGVDTFCSESGRYYPTCTASVVDAVAFHFYGQQCQPTSRRLYVFGLYYTYIHVPYDAVVMISSCPSSYTISLSCYILVL